MRVYSYFILPTLASSSFLPNAEDAMKGCPPAATHAESLIRGNGVWRPKRSDTWSAAASQSVRPPSDHHDGRRKQHIMLARQTTHTSTQRHSRKELLVGRPHMGGMSALSFRKTVPIKDKSLHKVHVLFSLPTVRPWHALFKLANFNPLFIASHENQMHTCSVGRSLVSASAG